MKVEKTHLYWLGGIFLIILIWKFGAVPVGRNLGRLDRRITKREEALQEISVLQAEYLLLKTGGVVRKDVRSGERFTPLAFLEKLSRETGVRCSLAYRDPRKLDDGYVETRVAVELNGIDMSQLIDYLYHVEKSPLNINNLRISCGKEKFLKVNFEVSHLLRND